MAINAIIANVQIRKIPTFIGTVVSSAWCPLMFSPPYPFSELLSFPGKINLLYSTEIATRFHGQNCFCLPAGDAAGTEPAIIGKLSDAGAIMLCPCHHPSDTSAI
jgi:hypothetical protein